VSGGSPRAPQLPAWPSRRVGAPLCVPAVRLWACARKTLVAALGSGAFVELRPVLQPVSLPRCVSPLRVCDLRVKSAKLTSQWPLPPCRPLRASSKPRPRSHWRPPPRRTPPCPAMLVRPQPALYIKPCRLHGEGLPAKVFSCQESGGLEPATRMVWASDKPQVCSGLKPFHCGVIWEMSVCVMCCACQHLIHASRAEHDCALGLRETPYMPARVGDANRSSSGIASFDTVFEAGKASPVQQSAVPRPAPAAPDAHGANAPLARAGTAPPAPEAVPHQGFIPYKWRHHGSAGAPGACGSGGGGLSPGASSGCKRGAADDERPVLPPRKRLHGAFASGV